MVSRFHTTMTPERQQLLASGQRIYEEQVAPRLKPRHSGWHALIDLNSCDYLLASRIRYGVRRMKLRHPDAIIWVARIPLELDQPPAQCRILR